MCLNKLNCLFNTPTVPKKSNILSSTSKRMTFFRTAGVVQQNLNERKS